MSDDLSLAEVAKQLVRLRQQRDKRIVRTYLGGNSLAATGAAFGISMQRVQQILQRHGVPRRSQRPRPMVAEDECL